jgi:hypothetical protein
MRLPKETYFLQFMNSTFVRRIQEYKSMESCRECKLLSARDFNNCQCCDPCRVAQNELSDIALYPHAVTLYAKKKGQRNPSCNLPWEHRQQRRGTANPSCTTALHWGGWVMQCAGHIIPGKQTWHPLYRRLDEPRRRYGRMRKTTPPSEFQPRTVQFVASSHTEYAIPAVHTARHSKVFTHR